MYCILLFVSLFEGFVCTVLGTTVIRNTPGPIFKKLPVYWGKQNGSNIPDTTPRVFGAGMGEPRQGFWHLSGSGQDGEQFKGRPVI